MATSKILRKAFQQATITLLLLLLSHHASAQQILNEHQYLHSTLNRSTAIILIIAITIFFSLGCICLYIRHCSAPTITSFARMDKPEGLDPETLRAFPTFLYSKVKNHKMGKRSLECAICLSEFEDHDTLRLLPKCNHVFHSDCIDTWLESQTTCPVCRADLVLQPDETFMTMNFESDGPETTKFRPSAEILSHGVSQDRPSISWSTKLQFGGIFPRSHSTGHSFIQHGGDVDRFTLILPEDVRAELIDTTFKTMSCRFDLPRMSSPKSGYKSEGSSRGVKGYNLYERFNRVFTTPPFIRKCRSTRFQEVEDSERMTTSRRFLSKSITMPVRCLFPEKESNGERSFIQLKFNTQV